MENQESNQIKKINKSWKITAIGWVGSSFIITAYALNALGYLSFENILYPLLNIFGALFIGITVLNNKNWSLLFLQIFWIGITILSIIKIFNN